MRLFGLQRNAGEKIGDAWYYVYRKCEPNEEGGGRGNSSMFAADVEAVAEQDALDDSKVVGDDGNAAMFHDGDSMTDGDSPLDRHWSTLLSILQRERRAMMREHRMHNLARRFPRNRGVSVSNARTMSRARPSNCDLRLQVDSILEAGESHT